MVQCFVAECDHSYSKNQCSFFRLPSDASARRTWEKLSGRPQDCSNDNSRICSCHFIGGVKAAGPSLFKWNQEMSHLQASDHGVKEEPEEKDVMDTKDCSGRPRNCSSLQKSSVDVHADANKASPDTQTHQRRAPIAQETKLLRGGHFKDEEMENNTTVSACYSETQSSSRDL